MDEKGRRRWKTAALLVLLAGLAVVAAHPHVNLVTGSRDPSPVHADEYVHWGYARAIVDQGTLDFADPFGGSEVSTGSEATHERGFQAYIGVLQVASGIPWMTLFAWGPTVLAILTGIVVYLTAERWNAGLFAVLWLIAVPTSLRFLGPAFFVPITFALPLVGLGLFILFGPMRKGSFAALLLLSCGLWTIHTMGAIVLSAAALLTAALWFASSPIRAAGIGAVIAAPLLLAHGRVEQLWADRQADPDVLAGMEDFQLSGVFLYIGAAIGSMLLLSARDRSRRLAGGALTILLIALMGIVAYRATTGIDPFRAADRSTLMAALLAAILAGRGAAALAGWSKRVRPAAIGATLVAALLLAQGAAVASAARTVHEQPYYVSLSQDELQAYTEADHILGPEHELALVGGKPTMPFTVITGIPTAFVLVPSSTEEPEWVRRFFAEGSNDTVLLVERGITVVVTDRGVQNPHLEQVSNGVYALKPEIVAQMRGLPAKT